MRRCGEQLAATAHGHHNTATSNAGWAAQWARANRRRPRGQGGGGSGGSGGGGGRVGAHRGHVIGARRPARCDRAPGQPSPLPLGAPGLPRRHLPTLQLAGHHGRRCRCVLLPSPRPQRHSVAQRVLCPELGRVGVQQEELLLATAGWQRGEHPTPERWRRPAMALPPCPGRDALPAVGGLHAETTQLPGFAALCSVTTRLTGWLRR